jgi:hypothetical protein
MTDDELKAVVRQAMLEAGATAVLTFNEDRRRRGARVRRPDERQPFSDLKN